MTEVVRYGTDSSGRPILMSTAMRDWWLGVIDALGYEPVIVQGAYMTRAGGGAAESAGYHDLGGCLDLRTWDHTRTGLDRLVRVLREHGAAAWRRDRQHGGMDPHLHFVCGWDGDLAAGARTQWGQYLAGRDGLASNGPDYEWRPAPLVTTPPEDDMTPDQANLLEQIAADTKATRTDVAALKRQGAKVREKVTRLIEKTKNGHAATLAELEELRADLTEETP